MEAADFGGWATKVGLKCSDGRTIMPGAFEHMDKVQVPLVWQHGHNEPKNVLGHAILESRADGIYAYGFFNNTEQGNNAREYVKHGDIKFLSIWANKLVEKGKNVIHGMIREVSLVLAGANPGAVIEYVSVAHGDGTFDTFDDEAIIYTDHLIEHSEKKDSETEVEPAETNDPDKKVEHAEKKDSKNDNDEEDPNDTSMKDVYESLTEDQKNLVHYMIGVALDEANNTDDNDNNDGNAEHSDQPASGDLTHKEGVDTKMSRNVFDQNKNGDDEKKNALSHADVKAIFADAVKCGSLREAVSNYASSLQHGIENIDVLFPDAKMATGVIELEKRRTEWVSAVLNGTRHTPFSKIKTFSADLTQDEARAKGYIKGKYKIEEWLGVTKRTTAPTTIYKKQKLDRDDLLDITDFDVVAFLKTEMRLMTEEEIARAILIGDGRSPSSDDKIKDPLGASDGTGIRSILNDHEFFVTTLTVNVDDANSTYEEVVNAVMNGMEFYKGTGTPTFFTTIREKNKFLQATDAQGRRFYRNKAEVADMLGVKDIVTVEPMIGFPDLIGILVNLDDYNVGTDRGGELTMFEDFDIDYNQQKYLLETRMSGALVRPKSALVVKKTAAANVLATPTKPAFVESTGVVTIPTVTGVVYKDSNGNTISAGAMTALTAGSSVTIYSSAASGYYFANTAEDSWVFKRPAS